LPSLELLCLSLQASNRRGIARGKIPPEELHLLSPRRHPPQSRGGRGMAACGRRRRRRIEQLGDGERGAEEDEVGPLGRGAAGAAQHTGPPPRRRSGRRGGGPESSSPAPLRRRRAQRGDRRVAWPRGPKSIPSLAAPARRPERPLLSPLRSWPRIELL
jgi:hypothetical protein